jgi:hypothetical protein
MTVQAGTWPLRPDKVPFKALLMEGEDSVPFTFSPVAPGYFLPSPSWVRAPRPGLIAPRHLPTYVPNPRLLMWSALHVRDLLSRMRDAFGPTLAEIRGSALKARQSRTLPAQPHPLADLLELLSVVYLYESDARPYLDPALVAQLHAECAIVERAAREGVWDEIRASCVTASGYSHTLAAFLAIDMLERRTSTVLPVLSTGMPTREPDIQLGFDGGSVWLEVKAPNALLFAPDAPVSMTSDEATMLVERLADDAIGSRKQIRADRPGMLLIGGKNLVPDETQHLEDAIAMWMTRRGRRYPFVSGIGLTFMSYGCAINVNLAVRAMPAFNYVHNPYGSFRFPPGPDVRKVRPT